MVNKLKYYLVAAAMLILVFAGFVLGRRFSGSKPHHPVVYSRIEEIRQVRQLRLVTYYFECMVEVCHEEKTDKSYLLLIIPVRVSCYVDLEQMQVAVEDTRITITLHDPVIESPVLDLDSAKIINLNQRYVTASKSAYETVVRNVQAALSRARQDARQRAEINGIREEALRLCKGYFEGLLGGLGYAVEFRSGTGPIVRDSGLSSNNNL